MRLIAFIIAFFGTLGGLFVSYAPVSERARLPAGVRSAIVAVNAALGAGTAHVHLARDRPFVTSVMAPMTYNLTDSGVYAAARFDRALLIDAVARRADFTQGYFVGARIDGADFSGSQFGRAILAASSARLANFSRGVFTEADLSYATFDGSAFSGARFADARLDRAGFRRGHLDNAYFSNGSAVGATFEHARLNGIDATYTDFRLADFSGADMTKAVLRATPVHGARFHGAILTDADLSTVSGLTYGALAGACGSTGTRLPLGFSLPLCADEPSGVQVQIDATAKATRSGNE